MQAKNRLKNSTDLDSLGHWLRRSIHVAMAIVPIAYYWYGQAIGDFFWLAPDVLLGFIVLIILSLELLRLSRGWIIVGQRTYESQQISAFTWGSIAIGIVLLLAPQVGHKGAAIATPLIWSLAFVDPLMGEMRRWGFLSGAVLSVGTVALINVWLLCHLWLATPLWLIPIMVPVTLAAEWPKLTWIDDNALMLLVPLVVILGLEQIGCL